MNTAELPTSPIVVLVTAGSPEEARAIARVLVEQQLAACVNYFPIQSIYQWKGEIQEDTEFQLLIKTDAGRFAEIEAAVKAAHSYDLPEIIALNIQTGSAGYLDWVAQQVSARH